MGLRWIYLNCFLFYFLWIFKNFKYVSGREGQTNLRYFTICGPLGCLFLCLIYTCLKYSYSVSFEGFIDFFGGEWISWILRQMFAKFPYSWQVLHWKGLYLLDSWEEFWKVFILMADISFERDIVMI